MNREEMYLSLGVSKKVLAFGETVLDELKPRFAEIDEIAELNQAKVIAAMQKNCALLRAKWQEERRI